MSTKAKSKRIAILLVVAMIVMACGNGDKEKRNEEVLPEEQMVELLTDIQLVESVVRVNAGEDEFLTDSVDYYSAIFEKHSVSKIQFEESMRYYTKHPADLENIYDQVLVKLSEREAGYEAAGN